jgi:protein-tyrosine-phosphatase
VTTADPITEVRSPAPVVFVCRNGVAMSVWSAAYFNRLAAKRGLPEWAAARASIASFSEVPLNMAFALAVDGFRLAGYRPEVISAPDVRNAKLVVAIDTDLPPEARESDAATEVWNGFPPMREEYFPSRAALKARVEALVDQLAATHARLHRGTSDPVVHEPADTRREVSLRH